MKILLLLLISISSFGQVQDDMVYTDNQIAWLKAYTDQRFESITRAVDKSEANNKIAIDKVETTYSDYRMQQNEWRGQIKDQAALFVTRTELYSAISAALGLVIGALALTVSYLKYKQIKS